MIQKYIVFYRGISLLILMLSICFSIFTSTKMTHLFVFLSDDKNVERRPEALFVLVLCNWISILTNHVLIFSIAYLWVTISNIVSCLRYLTAIYNYYCIIFLACSQSIFIIFFMLSLYAQMIVVAYYCQT